MPDTGWAPPPLSGWPPLIINVALTGAVPTKRDTPALPVTPEEIIDDIFVCAEAGASIFHVHIRDEQGQPVQRAEAYEEIFGTVRAKMPELILCGTTSGRVDPDPNARMTVMDLDEEVRPEMASLTLGSFNFPRVVSYNPPETIEALLTRMQERGVKPELEVFELGMINTARVLMKRGLIDDHPYFNILLGSMGAAPAFVGDLAHIVERLPEGSQWAAAGIGVFQPTMVVAGVLMGGNVRTGLEDSPRSTDDQPATNERAVRFAVDSARLLERAVATPNQARERLGLPVR
jgi:uncharacterized protein (DUF849 family)